MRCGRRSTAIGGGRSLKRIGKDGPARHRHAVAVGDDAMLVTRNVKDFGQIVNLKVVNRVD